MEQRTIYLGGDVSKGYCHFQAIDEKGELLGSVRVIDDTAEGHEQLQKWLFELESEANDDAFQIIAGLESSGGIEDNFLKSLKTARHVINIKVYHINPLIIRRFSEQFLHINRSDKGAALLIAQYLRLGISKLHEYYESDLKGCVACYRTLKNVIKRSAEVQNELQSILIRVQPELVQYCREGIPDWVVKLLSKYPTAGKLANAKVKGVASIFYINKSRAQSLIKEAKQSVASLIDEGADDAVTLMTDQIHYFDIKIKSMKKKLIRMLDKRKEMRILVSIKGIGEWTAAVLLCEIGEISRFPNPSCLVAYCGLDPSEDRSGDGVKKMRISKRGRSEVRGILYPGTQSAIMHSKPIKQFYARLRADGKGHFEASTACMRKMLNIVYACLITGEKFDPNYEERLKAEIEKKIEKRKQNLKTQSKKTEELLENIIIKAPVSSREAKKRRQEQLPQGCI